MSDTNPVGITGISFVEYGSAKPEALDQLFRAFGFSKTHRHKDLAVDYYRQNKIHFLLNQQKGTFAESFYKAHGPSICSMGWLVKDPVEAKRIAVERGAKAAEKTDFDLPAIYGIGDSLIYFVSESDANPFQTLGFEPHSNPVNVEDKGFQLIDHLTNNVYKGTMEEWSNFYKNVFGFTEVRYFDIRGAKTGLQSYALRSPDGSFCIPINEGTEKKSQINEYLDEYNGPGIQHLALATTDIVKSVEALEATTIETLDIDDEYYDTVFDRVPNVSEDHGKLRKLNILVDGDDEGYLLQIFTKNLIGPIFIEIIQRKNHHAFGEGNFGALFRSIEKDQERRGYL